jgi:protein translocase SecG subunit
MSTISSILPHIEIGIAILLVAAILLQQSGAANSNALGGGDNMSSVFHTRRGLEKFLFIATIVLGVLFAATAILTLVL